MVEVTTARGTVLKGRGVRKSENPCARLCFEGTQCTPAAPALGRQEDCEFKARPGYRVMAKHPATRVHVHTEALRTYTQFPGVELPGEVAVLAGVSLALSPLQMFNCITELVLRAKKDNLAKQQQQQQNDVVKLTKNSKRKKRCC